MGELVRDALPDPLSYFESEGLVPRGRGKWRTTSCTFHGPSDSMRVHLERGAFVCMACQAKGGDVLAYHRAAHGLGFVEAAKALGACRDEGSHQVNSPRPTPIPANILLKLVAREILVASVVASDMVRHRTVTDQDQARLVSPVVPGFGVYRGQKKPNEINVSPVSPVAFFPDRVFEVAEVTDSHAD